MKTFKEYLTENHNDATEILNLLNESHELSKENEAKIDAAVKGFMEEYSKGKDLEVLMEEMANEGILGSIFGGLTGFALGKTVGKTIASVLGIQKGVLYDMLTSRLVGAALGAALGKRL
jgi:ribosomal protein L21E